MTDQTNTDETVTGRDDAATSDEVDRLAEELREAGRPFARVTVVRREPPVSANVGDRALVTAEGDLHGWIGGVACAQSVAVKVAREAIDSGDPVLVGLAPDPEDVARPGLDAYPMTCHSGGTLELFVDPVLPTPRLVVVGENPVARALVRLAGTTDSTVTALTETADEDTLPGADTVARIRDGDAVRAALDGATAIVVASMGAYDEAGLTAALRTEASYVGLVASTARREELVRTVADALDVTPETVADAVVSPAGLDIGAKTPEEIAVSILAELVAVRRGAVAVGSPASVRADADREHERTTDQRSHDHGNGHVNGEGTSSDDTETAVDPVCGMTVTVDEAALSTTHAGESYYFCGEGCRDAFESDSERFTGSVVSGG